MKTKIHLPLFHIDHLIYPFVEGAFICKNGTYLDGFFMVDSGSTDNIFNNEAVHLLPDEAISQECRQVNAINNIGESCKVADVKIKVGDIEDVEQFNISQNLNFSKFFGKNRIIGVLGAGFMRKNGLALDYSQRCVRSSEMEQFTDEGKRFVCPMSVGYYAYGIPLVCLTNGEEEFFCVADSGCNTNTLTRHAMVNGGQRYELIDGQQSLYTISGETISDLAKVDFSLMSVGYDEEKGSFLVPDTDVFMIVSGQEHLCWCEDKDIPPISGLISSRFMLRNKWILDFNVGYIYVNAA